MNVRLRRASLVAALPLALAVPLAGSAGAQARGARSFDVVIYGGTAAGVVAAVSAARLGLTVEPDTPPAEPVAHALLEPTRHVGGMVTGGLSATDHGEKIVVGGDALAFYRRVGAKYGVPLFWYP